jgi:hypothetical protein
MKEVNLDEDYGKPANYGDELSHIKSGYVPITNKIGSTLFGNFRITTFHVTDIAGIGGVKKMINEKRGISSFTFMDKSYIRNLSGVRTSGGVLFQLEGKTLYLGNYNLMTYPDNRGKKWLGASTVLPSHLEREYHDMVRTFIRDNQPSNMKSYYGDDEKKPIEVVKFIAKFIIMVENFVEKNRHEIRNKAIQAPLSNSWNEVLIHDIVVKDVLWTTIKESWRRDMDYLNRKYDEDRYSLTDDEKRRGREYCDKIDAIEGELLSFCSGEIIHTDDPKMALLWITQRGGDIDFEEHKQKMKNKGY